MHDTPRSSDHGRFYFRFVLLSALVCGVGAASNVTFDLLGTDPPAALESQAVAAPSYAPVESAPSERAPRVEPWGFPHKVDIEAVEGDVEDIVWGVMDDGSRQELTVDPWLQRKAYRFLANYGVPYGATIAMDPRDGRVLAFAEYRSEGFDHYNAGRPMPAASLSKVLTASALLVQSDATPSEKVCVHGGRRGLYRRNLVDNPKRDNRCVDLQRALARSDNPAIAKLALRHLDPQRLGAQARQLGFGRHLFPLLGAVPSTAVFPRDMVGFGRAAAGFGEVLLSPMHAVTLASAIASGGLARRPKLFREEPGELPEGLGRLLPKAEADQLTKMLSKTTRPGGTAWRAFRRNRHIRRSLRGVQVAGKTGNITRHEPYRDYSWFMGWAPAEAPEIAVVSVVVNGPRWLTRGHYMASDFLAHYFAREKARKKRARKAQRLASR